jgi:hypothetical protein
MDLIVKILLSQEVANYIKWGATTLLSVITLERIVEKNKQAYQYRTNRFSDNTILYRPDQYNKYHLLSKERRTIFTSKK